MLRPSALILGFALLGAAPVSAPIKAGQWEITVHPNAIPIPRALAEAAEAFRTMMTHPETARVCLKKRDLTDLKPLFSVGGGQKSCTVSNLTVADGIVSANGQCVESDEPLAATIAGSYTATTFDYSVKRVTGGLDRPGTVAMTVSAKRIGSC